MATLKIFFGSIPTGAVAIHGTGDSSQDEQQDAELGRVVGGAAPPVTISTGGGGAFRLRRVRIHGRGDSAQPLQFSEGTGRWRFVVRGAGDSGQARQASEGRARLTFEALNEQELLELIMLDAA